jgi:hypothetical protein
LIAKIKIIIKIRNKGRKISELKITKKKEKKNLLEKISENFRNKNHTY